jgi:iron-sulfur cluster assembly protein
MQPITLTDTAAKQIESLLQKAPAGTQGVRLNVRPTGCSGNTYKMEYIDAGETLAADDVFESAGSKLYIPKMHSWMLFGMTVDYSVDDLGNAKFEFKNPNETGRCGCGESFHIDVENMAKPAGN